jgi:hypothetical protein
MLCPYPYLSPRFQPWEPQNNEFALKLRGERLQIDTSWKPMLHCSPECRAICRNAS